MNEMTSNNLIDPSDDIQARVDAYIDNQTKLDLLRFITCGSVDDGKSPATVTLQAERQEAQAIDYVKALAPSLIGTLGNVGTAAILADQAKASISANRDVRIVEAGVEGRVYDVLGAAVSGNAFVPDDTTDTADVTDTTDTTDSVDDGLDSTDDTDVTPTPDTTPAPPAVDCSGPQFSPPNPACAS